MTVLQVLVQRVVVLLVLDGQMSFRIIFLEKDLLGMDPELRSGA